MFYHFPPIHPELKSHHKAKTIYPLRSSSLVCDYSNQWHSAAWDICCIFLFHAWMCIEERHGNNQSSLVAHRAANYPTVKHTGFDCICIFHDLNCQLIWERRHLRFHPSARFTGAFVCGEWSLTPNKKRKKKYTKTTERMVMNKDNPARQICFWH